MTEAYLYCTATDVNDIYGVGNVAKWANLEGCDPDSDDGQAAIAARIAKAIEYATATINDYLRDGPYVVPITADGAKTTMTHLAATLAGVWLYECRGVQDFNPTTGQPEHRYHYRRKAAESQLADIRAGKCRLDAAKVGTGCAAPVARVSPPRQPLTPGRMPY